MLKKAAINALLVLGALALTLLAGELIARGYLTYQQKKLQERNRANLLTRAPLDDIFAEATPGGFVLRPNFRATWWGLEVQTDALGCRVDSRHEKSSDSARAILFFGDSMVFGVGLADSLTIPAQLERELAAASATNPVRCVNAGVIGYDLEQLLFHLQRLVPQIRPQLILIGVCHNDLFPTEDPFRNVLSERGLKVRNRAEKVTRVSAVSLLWTRVRGRVARHSSLYTLWRQVRTHAQRQYRQPMRYSDHEQIGLKKAPDLVRSFMQTTRDFGIPTAYIYFPAFLDLGRESQFVYVRELKANSQLVLDLSLSKQVTIDSYFSKVAQGEILPEMHFNPQGSRLVAREIALWLLEEGLWQ